MSQLHEEIEAALNTLEKKIINYGSEVCPDPDILMKLYESRYKIQQARQMLYDVDL